MTAVLIAAGVWLAAATVVAVLIGRAIHAADVAEGCCPHDEAEQAPRRFEAWL